MCVDMTVDQTLTICTSDAPDATYYYFYYYYNNNSSNNNCCYYNDDDNNNYYNLVLTMCVDMTVVQTLTMCASDAADAMYGATMAMCWPTAAGSHSIWRQARN